MGRGAAPPLLLAAALPACGAQHCAFPPAAPAARGGDLTANLSCSASAAAGASPLSVDVGASPLSVDVGAAGAAAPLYVDVRAQVYDMSPSAGFSAAATAKFATIPRNPDVNETVRMLEVAARGGAALALMTEEDFTHGSGAGEGLDGPKITALRRAVARLGIFVVCPFRLRTAEGESYNAVVVLGQDGSILRAALTGADRYEKQYPVLGWPVHGGGGFSVQKGEVGLVPGQGGVQVWDLPGLARVAVLTCFDIDFPEVWHQAYALGAQVVLWPSMMVTPNRDIVSYARLFRFGVVANGNPGAVVDSTGQDAADTTALERGVVTGTLDLDATWIHVNGPGALICPGLKRMCAAHPGAFEFAVAACGVRAGGVPGCAAAPPPAGESAAEHAVFLVRAVDPAARPVKPALARFGVVSFRDYIFQNRRGLNALRQARAPIPDR